MSGKVKLSKEDFATLLQGWFAKFVGREAIEQDAKIHDWTSEEPCWESREAKQLFGLSLANLEERTTLFEELMKLNLWIIVSVCEGKIGNVRKRNECLGIFHRQLFDQFFREAGYDFEQWLLALSIRYYQYREALNWPEMKPGTGLMLLGEAIYRNLHGDVLPGALQNFQIVTYVGTRMEALGELLNQYEIE